MIPVNNMLVSLWWVSDCEELVGEVNHTSESVTDLFSFVAEWTIQTDFLS